MRRPHAPMELLDGPFTRRNAEAAGVSWHALRGPAWRRIFHSVWVAATLELDRATWLRAARLIMPVDAVLCGPSAAEQHGVDVREANDMTVHVAFTDGVPRRRPGLAVRQLALLADEVTALRGWLVTTPIRTAFDCARWLPVVDAVVVVDALVHADLVCIDDLLTFAKTHPGVRWVRKVTKICSLAAVGAESPMETRLRLVLVLGGLPKPEPQIVVRTPSGVFVARVDMGYEALKVAVEYDGAWHWQQRRKDDRRRDALRKLGWTVLVFSAEDVYQHKLDVVRAVRDALAAAAA